jgi:hypothetical protein
MVPILTRVPTVVLVKVKSMARNMKLKKTPKSKK